MKIRIRSRRIRRTQIERRLYQEEEMFVLNLVTDTRHKGLLVECRE